MEFKDLNLAELDRNLTEEERSEWQAIYASYRSGSVITGTVVGVDMHTVSIVPKGKRKAVEQELRCLIVIPYRVKVIIPETEIFADEGNTGYHVLHSMCGANIGYVITHIDRENDIAVASRRLALTKQQRAFSRRRISEGQVVEAAVLAVGRNICTVTVGGYDILLPQRDVSYGIVPDMRETIRPGEVKKAVIKEYDKKEHLLRVSIKETAPHPFDGIETRHPLGCTRIATIVGKYGGGVFCRLYDGITDVLCSYEELQYDGDFRIGDSVEIAINKYNHERKLVYGRMLRKMHSK